jgi:branched-chain amino acid transport system substrate-binding protein
VRSNRSVVAVVAPLTGMAASLGRELVNAAALALEGSAEDGLELEIHDDAGAITQGMTVARALVARPEVVAVVGHYNSDVTLEAAAIYGQADLALVAPIVSNPALTDRRTGPVFRFTNRDDRTADALVSHLRERGKRRALVVTTATTYGTSMSMQFIRSFERNGGKVTFHLSVDEGRQDFDHLLAGVPADAVDLIFYGGTFEGAPLLRTLRARGFGQLFATGDGCWDIENFLRPAGASAEDGEGVLVLSATPEPGFVAGAAELVASYEVRYGDVNNYAVNSYEATRAVLLAALGAAGSRRAVAARLASVTFPGSAYPDASRFDDAGDNLAAVTALHTAREGRFCQVACIPAVT